MSFILSSESLSSYQIFHECFFLTCYFFSHSLDTVFNRVGKVSTMNAGLFSRMRNMSLMLCLKVISIPKTVLLLSSSSLNLFIWASEMVQKLKVLAAKSENLRSNPRTHMMEWKTQQPQRVPWLSHMPHGTTYTQ